MRSDIAISIRGLSKSYRIMHHATRHTTFGEALVDRLKHPFRRMERETFWALEDISFDVRRGEAVGIIGRNGAGKSTLLKLLSRISEPTRGEARIYGRIASLLEVGTGFHPELTGRENIYLNGSILGMSRREISRRFDEIVDFAEIENFLDTPVKRYSSGMYVRLAFAVAAHLEPEIVIVDEVLAVGDVAFQKKCLGKMGRVANEGRTVLFVSHQMQAIRQLCHTVLWLSGGRMKALGPSGEIVTDYLRDQPTSTPYTELKREIGKLPPDPTFRLLDIEIEQAGRPGTDVISGSAVAINISYEVLQEAPGLHVYFELRDLEGGLVFESLHNGDEEEIPTVAPGRYVSRAIIPAEFLAPMQYELRIGASLHGVRTCLPSPLSIALNVEAVGIVNRAYPGYRTPGKLAPLIEWETRSLMSVARGQRIG